MAHHAAWTEQSTIAWLYMSSSVTMHVLVMLQALVPALLGC